MKLKNSLIVTLCLILTLLSACSTTEPNRVRDGAPRSCVNADDISNADPKCEPLSRYGNPECYDVQGQKYYVLKSAKGYCKTGLASWYGTKFHGKKTSSREPYDMFAMTAASTNLPIPTYVEVTNLENGKKIIVKVNDRGPFKSDRIIDLSYAAAAKLGFANRGTANVQVKAIDPEDLRNEKISQEVLLASNNSMAEVQINPITLPAPSETSKPITLTRYVQLGAFSNHDNAEKLQKEISSYTDAQVMIKEGVSNNRPIYRVQVGPFNSVSESDSVLNTLKEKGYKDAITVFS